MRLTTIEPPLNHHYYVGPKLTSFRSAVGSAELMPSQSRGLRPRATDAGKPGLPVLRLPFASHRVRAVSDSGAVSTLRQVLHHGY